MAHKMAVLDILAKDIKADFGGTKVNGGRAKQRARVIDNAYRLQRCEIGSQTIKHMQVLQKF
jgi:hypothetical protein